jgi:hypothetical protein
MDYMTALLQPCHANSNAIAIQVPTLLTSSVQFDFHIHVLLNPKAQKLDKYNFARLCDQAQAL